ncbi:hypothetical protein IGI04_036414 [Brassica rapa subsp. trilocularis]|uniref:Uncharacterized protein n=1 Tax=Brassica rapa subsp. trilocularis TaxID=1813537 RepID=A0ABQ7LHF1_BRACM|nr:hypothetical protein IGI04_036414 [Brassica rapa subsp. trilocularis]
MAVPAIYIGSRGHEHRTSVGVRQHTQDVVAVRGCRQHTQDVVAFVCPSAHTGRLWCPSAQHEVVCVRQHTHDVRGCSVCVRVCPSAHKDVSGFPSYTQDVRGCPSAHTGRPSAHTGRLWLSVCVRVCPSAHTGRPWGVHQYTYQHVGPWTQHADPSRGLFGTQDIPGSPCVYVLSVNNTGRPWIVHQYTYHARWSLDSAHLALPVDCLGDFWPTWAVCSVHTWTSVGVRQHTQALWLSVSTHRTSMAVYVCPSAHTGRPWVSVSTHRMSVCVCQHTQDVRGCPSVHISARWSLDSARWPFPWTVWVILAHVGCLFSTHRTSVGVRQHTQDVRGCPSAHTGRPWLSVCVCVCPSAHTGRPWLSISTHISTLVLGLSTLTRPVDCSGDFGPRGLSVQYTHDVCGCPPAHTGRLWPFVCVRVCLSVSISRQRTSVAVHHYTDQHYTQDIRGCLPAHTGRPWLSVAVRQQTQDVRGCLTNTTSVAVRLCPCVSVSTHRTSVAVHQYTYQHVGPWTQHADPSRGLFVQYTQDVRGCPSAYTGRLSAHTGRLWLSVCVRVRPSAHTGRPWVSINTHISTLVLGLSTLTLPVDCSGDFGPRELSVQYTQDVCGCPPAHRTSLALRVCPCLSVSKHRKSVAVHQYTYHHVGPWTQHTSPSRGLFGTHSSTLVLGHSTLALPVDCSGDFGPRVSRFSTHRTSVAVRQHTQDFRGCPSAHTGRPWLSVCVCVCPSAHTGRPWLSISTHISTLALGLSKLTLPVDCSGDFGPRVLSVQYTQDVCGCPPAHRGRLWLSVCVRLCPSADTGRPWLSISTQISTTLPDVCGCRQHTHDVLVTSVCCPSVLHRTSVMSVCGTVKYTRRRDFVVYVSNTGGRLGLFQSLHNSTMVLGLRTMYGVVRKNTKEVFCLYEANTGRMWLTLALPVDCSSDFGPRGLSVQYTQDVRGCPPAHTGRPWLFVAVRQHTQDVHGCPCVSVSTHRTSVVVRQHTQDVHGCPSVHISARWPFPWTVRVIFAHVSVGSVHTGRPWLSVSTHRTSVGVRQHTQDVRGCPCVSVCVRQHTQDVHGCPSVHISARWTSVGVRQHTHDVRDCPCVSVSTHRTSLTVRVCPSAHTGRLWLSISTHISTLVLGLSTLALPVDCSGGFGPRGLSVQYTQDVCGCPPAHTGRPWLFDSTHVTSVAVRVCPCVSVSTHRKSVAVHQYTYQHAGPWTQHPGPSRGLTHRTSVAVRVCPSAHTGRPWLSVCPSAHTGRLWLSIGTHISTLVLGLSSLTLPVDCSGDFGPRGLSVQYTQDVHGCPPAHTGCPWLSVCVRMCPSAHTGRPWLSTSTHISMFVGTEIHTVDFRLNKETRKTLISQRSRISANTTRPAIRTRE